METQRRQGQPQWTVTKNVNAPKYQQASYESTINENAPVGVSILKVKANDADGVSFVVSAMSYTSFYLELIHEFHAEM